MEKHELQCDYRPHQCPGCQLQMLKKEFDNHVINCASIELTCEDCKVVYKKDEGVIKHTENICLKEQLRQLRNESKENQRQLQELTRQLTDITVSQSRLDINIQLTK
jgi:phage-related minor tail protein